MKSEEEILERIAHIKTLSDGYGINSRRIKELEWVLKPSKATNNPLCPVCGDKRDTHHAHCSKCLAIQYHL